MRTRPWVARALWAAYAAGALALAGCGGSVELPSVHVTVDLAGDPIRVETASAAVLVARDPVRVSFADRSRSLLLTREDAQGGMFYERNGRTHFLGRLLAVGRQAAGVWLTAETTAGETARVSLRFLTERTVEVTLLPGGVQPPAAVGARWHSPAEEVIYGLTERLRDSPPLAPGLVDIPRDEIRPPEVGSLNRRGERVEMFVRPTTAVYAPFYQSSRGYGIAVQGTLPGWYDVAHSEPEVIHFRFETGSTPDSQQLRLWVFLGPDFAANLNEYTALTGRPRVPPSWAFLHWRYRDELAMGEPGELDGVPVNAQVAEDVKMYEALGIPPGVYLLDRPVLEGDFGFARFAWDRRRLPNPEAMLASLRRRGYRIVMWSAAWACGTEPGDNGTEAHRLGFIAPRGSASPARCGNLGQPGFLLDATNPAARSWFAGKLADFVRSERLDGIKLDRGEEGIPSSAEDLWYDGRNGREVHNDYPRLQAAMHREALEAAIPNGDWVLIARAAYTGTQRDAIVWGGDIPGSESFGAGPGTDLGLRSAIIAQQRVAFLGFPIWGSDTGGYYEFKDRDVFARWIEFSAFSGIMEIGGTGSHAPWDMPTEPRFDPEMIEIYRFYTTLRARMLDYIARSAAEAARGLPLVRPLAFLDAGDPQLQDRWDEFLFGPDLLVAPVWRKGQRDREVFIPSGRWRSLWDERIAHAGPVTVHVDVPLHFIPVYIREGALSPLAGE